MQPVLYSFRRCPYAIRARMAVKASAVSVSLREVELKDKPIEMLAASPKGTVPVLILNDGTVIDESLDIMQWALSINDPENWLNVGTNYCKLNKLPLIKENDSNFKYWLDRYKYADRYPEQGQYFYRSQGELFLTELDQCLQQTQFLVTDKPTAIDIAIFPFIRQFANTDTHWFYSTEYQALQTWLSHFLESSLFLSTMKKYPPWSTNRQEVNF